MSANYPSDLLDGQWQWICKLLPKVAKTGRRPIDRRWIINAILYVNRTGCQWRALPHDFPNWKTVYTVFWRCVLGVWMRVHEAALSISAPSGGQEADPQRGDPRQPIDPHGRGRRRTGLRCRQKDHGAQAASGGRHLGPGVDGRGAWGVLARPGRSTLCDRGLAPDWARLKVIFGDSAYGREGLPAWVQETFGWILQTVLRPVQAKGFVVLPKRWIVERTFAWLARYRRHSRDYEHKTETSETMIYISMIALMSRRLARKNNV